MTDARIDKIEKQVAHALEMVRRVNERCSNILAARNHYLRHRAPGVLQRQRVVFRAMQRVAKRLESIPRMSLQVTHKARNKDRQNVLLMVTANQARKLRALADADLRHLLNGASNARSGKRARLVYSKRTEYGKRMAARHARQEKNRLSYAVIEKPKDI
jgi:hypothetical protein